MKFGVRFVIILGAALPIAALAQEQPMPRMLKGMGKGQWRVEMLEHSQMKQGQSIPAMTICTDNLAKHSADKAAQKESKCKHRLVKDGADEAVTEISCPERTVTTTMRRESAKSVLMDVKSAGKGAPMTMKMRYTNIGACREGQAAMSMDKDSEHCRKVQASLAKMDPGKSCASAKGEQRTQCESMMRQQIAQAKAMCGG